MRNTVCSIKLFSNVTVQILEGTFFEDDDVSWRSSRPAPGQTVGRLHPPNQSPALVQENVALDDELLYTPDDTTDQLVQPTVNENDDENDDADSESLDWNNTETQRQV